jgi:hypothetical protein
MNIEEIIKVFGKAMPTQPNLPNDKNNGIIIGIAVVLAIGGAAYMIHRNGKRKNESDKLTN